MGMNPPARFKANQDQIINQAIKKQRMLTIYLKNGVHIKGRVLAHDSYTILLDNEKHKSLVYKHSITSIFPARLARR